MAKLKPSLESFAGSTVAAKELQEIPTAPPDVSGKVQASVPARRDRPHTTLYLDKATLKTIKEIALQYDLKAHDLYIEGINMMLRHYGKPPIEGQGRR